MKPLSLKRLDEIEARANAATKGPWVRCHHLQSVEADKDCPCGYRGGIWGGDKEHVVCEMGTGPEPDAAPRYERTQEIANSAFIEEARMDVPDLAASYREAVRLVPTDHTASCAAVGGHRKWWGGDVEHGLCDCGLAERRAFLEGVRREE